jgi:parallel beta-helix repeat protein
MKRMLPVSAFLLAISCGPPTPKGTLSATDLRDGGAKLLQETLIAAKPGSTIDLPEGKYQIDRTLSLSVENVTIRGKGIDKTILSFKDQKTGSAGMLVTSSGFTLEDLAIEDSKGDALKINGATNVTIRRVRTEWTGGPKPTNGSYGLYPVQCKNVLIEDSVAIGASDAGIYVGQSNNIVVRRNRAEFNVAGIEIENSQNADVYENTATKNTGGILVFNLPDLPIRDGKFARVFNNKIVDNSTPNFAPKGNMVATVPTGTGLMILATSHIDVYKNTIQGNGTANISVISYLATGKPINDKAYDPFTSAIYLHDNTISGGGKAPDGHLAKELEPVVGKTLPDIFYDGVLDPAKKVTEDSRVCIQNNGDATFVNVDAGNKNKKVVRDLKGYNCALPPMTPVTLAAASTSASD